MHRYNTESFWGIQELNLLPLIKPVNNSIIQVQPFPNKKENMNPEPQIHIRKITKEDYQTVCEVEALSTPNLRYVPHVFDLFLTSRDGAFLIAEMDGKAVGIANLSILPDHSAWLETLRVIPEVQGRGVGKRFYEKFLEIAEEKKIKTLRMYTGLTNHASKGLAERFGFSVAAEFQEAWLTLKDKQSQPEISGSFRPVTDLQIAASLLLPYQKKWNGFLVFNRTFFTVSDELCLDLVRKKMLYHDSKNASLIVLGSRFMPWQSLHIGLLGGDRQSCLDFACREAISRKVERINCLFPPEAAEIKELFTKNGYEFLSTHLIVMETHLRR